MWLNHVLSKLTRKDARHTAQIVEIHKQYMQYPNEAIKKYQGLFTESITMLNSILPDDVTVIPDAGNHWLNTLSLYRTKNIEGFMTNAGLGSMGHAIGCSIGISLADKNKPMVCITGDGSALMSGTEISVAAEQHCPIIFLVYNNNTLGRVRCYQEANNAKESSDLPENDFRAIGRGLGAQGIRVRSLDQFCKAIRMALESQDTWVIEVIVPKHDLPVFLNGKDGR